MIDDSGVGPYGGTPMTQRTGGAQTARPRDGLPRDGGPSTSRFRSYYPPGKAAVRCSEIVLQGIFARSWTANVPPSFGADNGGSRGVGLLLAACQA